MAMFNSYVSLPEDNLAILLLYQKVTIKQVLRHPCSAGTSQESLDGPVRLAIGRFSSEQSELDMLVAPRNGFSDFLGWKWHVVTCLNHNHSTISVGEPWLKNDFTHTHTQIVVWPCFTVNR